MRDIRLEWLSPRTHDTHTYETHTHCSRLVTTCFYDRQQVCRGWYSNTINSTCKANSLTDCCTAAAFNQSLIESINLFLNGLYLLNLYYNCCFDFMCKILSLYSINVLFPGLLYQWQNRSKYKDILKVIYALRSCKQTLDFYIS